MPSDTEGLPPDEAWTGDFTPPEAGEPGRPFNVVAPEVREPRAGIAINGVRIDALLLECAVTNNRFQSADTFRATLMLNERADTPWGPARFGSEDRMEIELFAGLGTDAPPSTSLILGRADDVDIDFAKRVIQISGRDFTADLLETQTTEKWPNRTSSEIARELAGRHNLTPVVTDTSRLSGHYYQQEHARLTDATTEWNLLTYLADQEGFDVFMRGRELHFGPPPDARSAPRWHLLYQPADQTTQFARATTGGLRVRRNLTLAQDILVRVVSWNARQKKSFTVTRRSNRGAGRGSTGRFASSTPHVFRLPGLTEEQAIREAERRLADLSKHERVVEVDGIPADANLDVRMILALRGTGTTWDRDYTLDEVERRYSSEGGGTMRMRARILAPDNTATL